jgi:hypothetical protein
MLVAFRSSKLWDPSDLSAAGPSAYATVAKYGRPFAESADAGVGSANPSPETVSLGYPI